MSSVPPPNWASLEAAYKQEIEALTESAEMSAIEKDIAEEKLRIIALDFQQKEKKYLEQIKIYEEQIDVSQSAHEMVEKLTQQKTELEDKLKDMIEDLDCMEKLRYMNEELLESARQNEIELTGEIDKLRVQCFDLTNKRRDIEYYLTDQEKTLAKLRDENRALSEELSRLKDQSKEGESIEQQKHQIENVAYKLNLYESRIAEKKAEVDRYKRNLSELQEQMNNLSIITREQSTRLDELKFQYDAKVKENSDLQYALKKKMEEVSELQIKMEMATKKLQSIKKDKETQITSLTKQIETMKGIQIQHEEDMKRLMEDNELIERERRELREQLTRTFRSPEQNHSAMNASMVTAQDTSLASLGINLLSPLHQQAEQQSIAGQTPGNTPGSALAATSVNISNAISPLSTSRRLFPASSSPDESMQRVRELGIAFDQMIKRNHQLEMDLAATQLNKNPPQSNLTDLSSLYDFDKTRSLRGAVDKLKREIRASVINQQICPHSRRVRAQLRNDQFNAVRLAMKCQALEFEAKSSLHLVS